MTGASSIVVLRQTMCVFLFMSIGLEVGAAEMGSGTECFDFTARTAASEPISAIHQEKWCYQPVPDLPGAVFIFNADRETVRPELSALVEADGSLTHASLLAGQVTVHRLRSDYNPMPVPLKKPMGLSATPSPLSEPVKKSAAKALEFLRAEPVRTIDLSFREGELRTSASVDVLPWRGYWWPYSSGRLHRGFESPLAKFDRFARARTGERNQARAWEKKKHAYTGNKWSGHCNGWAASSILRAEPKGTVTDPVSGVQLSVADQKAILAVKDYCVNAVFFGDRYDGKPGDDITDVHAADFHNTVLYYIGELKKPIAMDRFREVAVDNHVASGYQMKIVKQSPTVLSVTTVLTMHKYDSDRVEIPGPAPTYKRTFSYMLWLDRDGRIKRSRWLSGNNPDFLWVPLSPLECSIGNPAVNETLVGEINKLAP